MVCLLFVRAILTKKVNVNARATFVTFGLFFSCLCSIGKVIFALLNQAFEGDDQIDFAKKGISVACLGSD